ncbi:hypothetical protein [Clostridioides difficile]|nr:hypothetical protein [Clostridioides difficile]NMQ77333.1 hypothetical protein [Clostridioides difficile]
MEKSNTTVTKKKKIEDIGMKLEHLLSEDITFMNYYLRFCIKKKEEN